MRTCLRLITFALLSGVLLAQMPAGHSSAKAAAHPAVKKSMGLMTGVGNLHHPVSTKNPQAQEFFDQGLRLIYAFNHDEAANSFRHAAELDPKLAMAFWGIAEAVGPNYNDPASDERFKHQRDRDKDPAAAPVAGLLLVPSERQGFVEADDRICQEPEVPWGRLGDQRERLDASSTALLR